MRSTERMLSRSLRDVCVGSTSVASRTTRTNAAFAPIELREGHELVVWGVVTRVVKRLR